VVWYMCTYCGVYLFLCVCVFIHVCIFLCVYMCGVCFQRERLAYECIVDLYTDVKADQGIKAQAVGRIGDKTG